MGSRNAISRSWGRGAQKKKNKEVFQQGILHVASVFPNFNLKKLGKRSQKKKKKEVFQQEILRVASVFPNSNLKKLGKRSQKKRRRKYSNKKFYVLLLYSRISI